MALKSRSYILDLVHEKLSCEIFFFIELFNGVLIRLDFRIKNTQQKAANLMFFLTSTAEEVQFKVVKCNINFFLGGYLIRLVWGSQDMPMQCNAML